MRDFEQQARTYYNLNDLERFALNIEKIGLLHPIIVLKYKKDDYVCISGHRRRRALELLGYKGVECRVYNVKGMTTHEILSKHIAENSYKNLEPYEEAEVLSYFYHEMCKEKNGKFSKAEYSRMTNYGVDKINDALKFVTLNREIKDAVALGLLPYGGAIELTKIPGKNRRLQYLDSLLHYKRDKGKVTTGFIKAQVENYLQSKTSPSLFNKYKIEKESRKALIRDIYHTLFAGLREYNSFWEQIIRLTKKKVDGGEPLTALPINSKRHKDRVRREIERTEKLIDLLKTYVTGSRRKIKEPVS